MQALGVKRGCHGISLAKVDYFIVEAHKLNVDGNKHPVSVWTLKTS